MSHSIKEALEKRIFEETESGLWSFRNGGQNNLIFDQREYVLTERRIHPKKLYNHRFALSELAADKILEESTGGILGTIGDHDISWIRGVYKALQKRGAEMPASEVNDFVDHKSWGGVKLEDLPKGTSVTLLTETHTLGQQIKYLAEFARHYGLRVNRAVTLVDRNPNPVRVVDGIEVDSVLHVPLPHYSWGADQGRRFSRRFYTGEYETSLLMS